MPGLFGNLFGANLQVVVKPMVSLSYNFWVNGNMQYWFV